MVNVEQFGKSFKYIMKNGPKADPCGTPQETFLD